ncbi:hypothetical protein F2P56_032487, partial [Juglans regia]
MSWKDICTPADEGGLGIRDFGDVQKALHMKLAWNLIQGKSLWAKFFGGKYVKGTHLLLLEPSKGTRFWKSIVRSIPEVLNSSKWVVREGNISFCLVGHQKASELYDYLARRKEGTDVLVWLRDTEGIFTTKSAWDCIRVRTPPLPWAQWIWHANLPTKISIMMWKATNNCLSVDDKIKIMGISMASKCNCCQEGHTEDL